jgi:5-methylcytosine-specific restriction protein B
VQLKAERLLPYPEPDLAYIKTVDRIRDLWNSDHKFVVLSGPPGTGKTRCSEDLVAANHYDTQSPVSLDDCRLSNIFPEYRHRFYSDLEILEVLREKGVRYTWEMIVLHPQYAYEDLIRGYRFEGSANGNPQLAVREGILGFGCRVASILESMVDSSPTFTLILDEINRAPIGQLFGEALYAIDRRGSAVTTPYDLKGYGSHIVVPGSVQLIGTMNSVDRALSVLDLALRRRISGIRIKSDRKIVETRWSEFGSFPAFGLALYDLLRDLVIGATALSDVATSELVLGHSYFLPQMKLDNEEAALRWLWKSYAFRMAPALQDYVEQSLVEFSPDGLSLLPLGLGLRIDEIVVIDETEAIDDFRTQLSS